MGLLNTVLSCVTDIRETRNDVNNLKAETQHISQVISKMTQNKRLGLKSEDELVKINISNLTYRKLHDLGLYPVAMDEDGSYYFKLKDLEKVLDIVVKNFTKAG